MVWKSLNVATFNELGRGWLAFKNTKGGQKSRFQPVLLALWTAEFWTSAGDRFEGPGALSVLQVPQSAASEGHWRWVLAAQLWSQVKPHQQLYSVHWGPCSDPAFNTTHPPSSLCGCAVGVFLLNSKGVALLSFSEGRVWRALYQSCSDCKAFSLCTGGKTL